MYAAFFLIIQYPSGNPYFVTKLLPLSLGFNFYLIAININVPFTPNSLPIRRTVIENLEPLQFILWRGLSLPKIILNSPSLQRKEVSSKLTESNEHNKYKYNKVSLSIVDPVGKH